MRILLCLFWCLPLSLQAQLHIVHQSADQNLHFPIAASGSPSPLVYSSSEQALVGRAARFLAGDIEKVCGLRPQVVTDHLPKASHVIIVGTPGANSLLDRLIEEKKLDVNPIVGRWEAFLIQSIEDPFPGVEEALVIVGSDRRGVAYGVFSLSEQMGVSPWHWWADVPVMHHDDIYLERGSFISEGPSVKYRGIFINDEAPALRNWALEKFGGFNSEFYERVFELILRNRGNYLWPAMWVPSMFFEDDPLNGKLADEYGIVMATTHHEPMMRAHAEWYRFGGGEWNYLTNKSKLQEFWRGGIERLSDYERVVTVGMRGDGDEAMTEETAVELMQTIIADQRQIIEEVTGEPAHETKQVWAVYKEVQDYYDKGMRVDDDILVLLCDDNWGNLRILPKKEDQDHPGGYGIYYHFDYVGAPVSYRWHNVTQIERTWEQMHLAWENGVRDLWLVNVGDIKPMELPISFFLDFAWSPDDIQAKDLPGYYLNWAREQFGDFHPERIARLLSLYTKYNARRTPEMLKPETYSLDNYREADRILNEYRSLLEESSWLYDEIPQEQKAAYYQLVHSPIEMCCNLNEMYVAAAKNRHFARQGRASANVYAEKVKEHFFKDAQLSREYHQDLLDGKWNHMMSQVRIGYSSWDQPRANIMPAVSYVQVDSMPRLGYVLEPGFGSFDPLNQQDYYIEIYNRGGGVLAYELDSEEDWIQLSQTRGSTPYDDQVFVSINWEMVPDGVDQGTLKLRAEGQEHQIGLKLDLELPEASGFLEKDGVVSIEAVHFTRKVETDSIRWTRVPNLGRTHSSMITEPVNVGRQTLHKDGPRLEYDFTVFKAGQMEVECYLSPTQNLWKTEGLTFAVSIDDGEPQVINLNQGEIKPDWAYATWWMKSVGDHIKIKSSIHEIERPGKHTLKIWAMDPAIVFQKFVIDAGGKLDSYLGPPESKFVE